jgi:glycosyltransferase involved in cell wall biosynthesis
LTVVIEAGAREAMPGERPVLPERKVVHLIAPLEVGGAESVVRELASRRHQMGGRTEVAVLLERPGVHPLVEDLQLAGIPVHVVYARHRRYRSQIRSVSEVLARTGASVVHTHVYHANFVGYWAARRCGRPVVATFHGFVGGGLKHRAYEWLDSMHLRRFHAVMCVSNQVRTRLLQQGYERSRVVTVPNGHSGRPSLRREVARDLLAIPQDCPAVGWVGRLSREKGPDLFLHAIRETQVEGTVAVLIGMGEDHHRLVDLVSSLGFRDGSVRLVGQRTDAASLLAAFDVLAITSRTEGLPMVLLEAMAAGTPIVAFAVGGVPQVISEQSAWLVPSEDVSAMTRALTEALCDRVQATRRAAAAREVLQARFSPDRWVARVEAIYEQAERSM